jgi:uncharacterized protein YpmS
VPELRLQRPVTAAGASAEKLQLPLTDTLALVDLASTLPEYVDYYAERHWQKAKEGRA